MSDEFHTPALLKEVIENLNIKPGAKYIDATIGGGGHSFEILKRGGVVLGIDQDEDAVEFVKNRSQEMDISGLTVVQGNFRDIEEIAKKSGFEKVAGILFDLGVSSHQFEDEERGFSFKSNAPLDMRMDKKNITTAADIINTWPKEALNEILKTIGQEQYSGRIVDAISSARPLKTCRELAELCVGACPPSPRLRRAGPYKVHPATKTFMALRIVTNDEYKSISEALPQAVDLLEVEGRLAVISFHSGEDRIVKNLFREEAKKQTVKILTKKPIEPSYEEKTENPRARSAKLRVAEKN